MSMTGWQASCTLKTNVLWRLGIYRLSTSSEDVLLKAHRVWIEIVLLGAAIACALALLLATLGAAAGAAVDGLALKQQNPAPSRRAQDAATPEQTYEGVVTCSRCKAKHSAALGQSPEVCVRMCVHAGAHFALVNAESVFLLDGNLGALKKVAGERVRVVGNLEGDTIRVKSVRALS